MKVIFTGRDKLRIMISLAVLVGGLLIIGLAFTPLMNPPQCPAPNGAHCIIGANIGGGLVWLLGIVIAVAAGIALFASLVFAVVARRTKKSRSALLLTLLIVGCTVAVAWYYFLGATAIKDSDYQAEVQKRQANFVLYQGAPKLSAVTKQSAAVSISPGGTDISSFVTLDLHGCSPGTAQVTYASGVVHFVFSGVRKDKSLEGFNASQCVFYVGKETAGQPWDGLLHAKCVWSISETLADNRPEFRVTDAGIQFGQFPGNCSDVRTGIAPESSVM